MSSVPQKKSSPVKSKGSSLNPNNNAQKPQSEQPDTSKMTPQELQIFQKYGKLPTKKDVMQHKLKERKYFDSGDYALYKAGTGSGNVGSVHPSPDMIPHSSPQGTNNVQVHPIPHSNNKSGLSSSDNQEFVEKS